MTTNTRPISALFWCFIFLIFSQNNSIYGQSPLYAGTRVSDSGTNNNIGSANTSRNVTVDSQGNIYVAYANNTEVRIAKSTNGGQSFLPSVLIATVNNAEPEIAVNEAGIVFVAWKDGSSINLASSTDGGNTFPNIEDFGFGIAGDLHMATFGTNVYITNQRGTSVFSNGNNGIGTFTNVSTGVSMIYADVFVDVDGIVHVPMDDPNLILFRSENEGASLTQTPLSPPGDVYYSSYALSDGPCGKFIFVGGGDLTPSQTLGYKINVDTGEISEITLGENDFTSEARTLFADNRGTLIDGYRSLNGDLMINVSSDQGTTFNTPIVVANGESHNITRSPTTDNIVVVYEKSGEIFLSVYNNLLKNIVLTEPSPSLNLCPGENFELSFTLSGIFNENTEFNVYLSDENGNFDNPTEIGSITTNTNGTVNCTLPNNLTSSSDYQIFIGSIENCLQSNTIPATINTVNISGDTETCLGNSIQLTGSGTPNATNPWTSSNTSVATVNNNGLITTVGVGTIEITYTVSGGCSETHGIEVFEVPTVNDNVSLEICNNTSTTGFDTFNLTDANSDITSTAGVTISYFETENDAISNTSAITNFTSYENQVANNDSVWARIESGNDCFKTSKIDLTVYVIDISGDTNACLGETIQLNSVGTQSSTNPWVSSNTSVATVNDNGLITTVGVGTTEITYTVSVGCSETHDIEVFEVPTVNNNVSLEICNNTSTTGFDTFNLTDANSDITSTSGVTITYFETETDAISNTSAISNFTSYENQVANNDSVWARIENGNGCFKTSKIDLTVFVIDITGETNACLGETIQLNSVGTPNTTNPWVSSNTSVATINNNGLITTVGVGTTEITYNTSDGCSKTYDIEIFEVPTVTENVSLQICNDTSTSGFETFNLTDANSDITSTSGVTITYFEIENNAISNTSSITNFASYQNQVANNDSVWARIENPNGCFKTSQINLIVGVVGINGVTEACLEETIQLTSNGTPNSTNPWTSSNTDVATVNSNGLITTVGTGTTVITFTTAIGCSTTHTFEVLEIPTVNESATIQVCNETSGFYIFDLTDANADITSSSSVTISYFETENDAISNTSAIPNPTAYQNQTVNNDTVWARIENPNGCFKTSQLNLIVENTSVSGDTEACVGETIQLNFTGIPNTTNPWTSSNTTVATVDNQGLVTANKAGTVVITFTAAAGCNVTHSIEVFPLPNANPNASLLTCNDGNGFGTFDLTNANSQISTDTTVTITYFESENDAIANTNSITNFTAYQNQVANSDTIWARIENSNGCFRTSQIDLGIISPIDYTISTTDETDNNNSIIITVTNEDIENYEYSLLDEQNNTLVAFQDVTSTFNNLPPGVYVVLIRDKANCNLIREVVSLIKFPEFFTPNNDGINDVWSIKGFSSSFYTTSNVYIFNRYGKLLAKLPAENPTWNGIYKNRPLPSTDYWYLVELEDIFGNKRSKKGHFSLLRR